MSSTDFAGSINHADDTFHIAWDAYRRILGLRKPQRAALRVLEVEHDCVVRSLLMDSSVRRSNGRQSKKPRYQQVRDIPEQDLWFSLSNSEMSRRTAFEYSERSIQAALPYLEHRRYVKTRFVRFDEAGKIAQVFACTGTHFDEGAGRWVNSYQLDGVDMRTLTKQFLFRAGQINHDLRHDGPILANEEQEGEDDAYHEEEEGYEDTEEEAETPNDTSAQGNKLGGQGEASPVASIQEGLPKGKNGSKFATILSRTENGSKNVGSNSAILGSKFATDQKPNGSKSATDGSKSATDGSNFANQKNRSNGNNSLSNNNRRKRDEQGTALSRSSSSVSSFSDSSVNEKETTLLELPAIGTEITPQVVAQILAYYCGLPTRAKGLTVEETEEKAADAYVSIAEKLKKLRNPYFTDVHARETVIRLALYMRREIKFYAERPNAPLYPWKIDDCFDEYLNDCWNWHVPAEFEGDLYGQEAAYAYEQGEEAYMGDVQAEGQELPQEEVWQAAEPQQATRITEPLPAPTLVPASAAAVATDDVDVQEEVPPAPTPEQVVCAELGLASRYVASIRRLLLQGYTLARNRDESSLQIIDQSGTIVAYQVQPYELHGYAIDLVYKARGKQSVFGYAA